MRRALVVGIDDYPDSPLSGCVNDAIKIAEVLRKNYDDSQNFECKSLVSSDGNITKAQLKKNIHELLEHEADVALLFFAGHGTVNNLGGYLVTPDATQYDEGVSMQDVLSMANRSGVLRWPCCSKYPWKICFTVSLVSDGDMCPVKA